MAGGILLTFFGWASVFWVNVPPSRSSGCPASAVVATVCLVASAGILALGRASTTPPFVLTAIGYGLFGAGAGFGTVIRGTTQVAMRDVPAGMSGAASGELNASRQIGTSVGLAVLGAIGVNAAISDWTAKTGRFPASIRAAAPGQAQNVGRARIGAVSRTLGCVNRQPAGRCGRSCRSSAVMRHLAWS